MGTKEKKHPTYSFSLKGFVYSREGGNPKRTLKSQSKNLLEIVQYKSWGQYAALRWLSWRTELVWKCCRKPHHTHTPPQVI